MVKYLKNLILNLRGNSWVLTRPGCCLVQRLLHIVVVFAYKLQQLFEVTLVIDLPKQNLTLTGKVKYSFKDASDTRFNTIFSFLFRCITTFTLFLFWWTKKSCITSLHEWFIVQSYFFLSFPLVVKPTLNKWGLLNICCSYVWRKRFIENTQQQGSHQHTWHKQS